MEPDYVCAFERGIRSQAVFHPYGEVIHTWD
jgi:hypothetical protein